MTRSLAIKAGIAKINVATELGRPLRLNCKALPGSGTGGPAEVHHPAGQQSGSGREKIRLFGSQGKAPDYYVDEGAWTEPCHQDAPE